MFAYMVLNQKDSSVFHSGHLISLQFRCIRHVNLCTLPKHFEEFKIAHLTNYAHGTCQGDGICRKYTCAYKSRMAQAIASDGHLHLFSKKLRVQTCPVEPQWGFLLLAIQPHKEHITKYFFCWPNATEGSYNTHTWRSPKSQSLWTNNNRTLR